MSRVFTDSGLLSWEAFASTGAFGLPQRPKIVFLCLSDPGRRARYIEHDGDTASAQRKVLEVEDARLKELLVGANELP